MIPIKKLDTNQFKIERNRKFMKGLDEALDRDGVHALQVKVGYEPGEGTRFVVVDTRSEYGKIEILEIGDQSLDASRGRSVLSRVLQWMGFVSRAEPVDLSKIEINLHYFAKKHSARKYLASKGYGSAFGYRQDYSKNPFC